MYVMIRVMLYFKNMQLNAAAIYGEESYYKYYPTVLYSVLPAVATVVFEPIAHALNKFEGHTTKVHYYNIHIVVNSIYNNIYIYMHITATSTPDGCRELHDLQALRFRVC